MTNFHNNLTPIGKILNRPEAVYLRILYLNKGELHYVSFAPT